MDTHAQLYVKVDRLLWERWDPIGVNEHDDAEGEYSGYVSQIVVLLERNAGVEEIAQHLSEIVTKRMGLLDDKEHSHDTASMLKALFMQLKPELIPLADVPDEQEFWAGTRFRQVNVGMNIKNKSDDFYEYMLINDNSIRDYMLLANVSLEAGRYKAGFVIAHVRTLENVNRHVVTGAAMKFSFGIEETFLVDDRLTSHHMASNENRTPREG
jgi:hypothetical protein